MDWHHIRTIHFKILTKKLKTETVIIDIMINVPQGTE